MLILYGNPKPIFKEKRQTKQQKRSFKRHDFKNNGLFIYFLCTDTCL